MITIIDNEPAMFEGGTMSDEEFVSTEDFKNITKALNLLAKSCPSFVVSAYTAHDHSAVVYNHAAGRHKDNNHMYDVVKKQKGEKSAKEALRGTELATHITNLLIEADHQYHVDSDAVIDTVKRGRTAMDSYEKLDAEEKEALMEALKHCESTEEAMDIMRAKLDVGDAPKRNGGHFRKEKYQALQDMFVRTQDKEDIDIKKMERNIKLATGAEAKAFKLSDPECIKPLARSLANNLKSTVLVGSIDIDEDGNVGDNFIDVEYQKDLEKIAKKNDLEYEEMRIALASSLCVAVFKALKKRFDLPDGLFEKYMHEEKL